MERKTPGLTKDGLPADAHRLLEELPGRTPEEVLADIGQASLGRSIVVATIACVVGMGVLTVGPFLLSPPKPAAASVKAVTTPAKPAEPAPAPEQKPEKPAATASTPSPEAVKKLGVDEVKSSDPKNNPLDGAADDLLKDIK